MAIMLTVTAFPLYILLSWWYEFIQRQKDMLGVRWLSRNSRGGFSGYFCYPGWIFKCSVGEALEE